MRLAPCSITISLSIVPSSKCLEGMGDKWEVGSQAMTLCGLYVRVDEQRRSETILLEGIYCHFIGTSIAGDSG